MERKTGNTSKHKTLENPLQYLHHKILISFHCTSEFFPLLRPSFTGQLVQSHKTRPREGIRFIETGDIMQ